MYLLVLCLCTVQYFSFGMKGDLSCWVVVRKLETYILLWESKVNYPSFHPSKYCEAKLTPKLIQMDSLALCFDPGRSEARMQEGLAGIPLCWSLWAAVAESSSSPVLAR